MDDDEFGDDSGFNEVLQLAERLEPAAANPSTGLAETALQAKVQQLKPQVLLSSRSAPSAILVSTRQKGNPILKNIHGQAWEYADIPADYVLGATTCALFLSLKYHRLHPEYVYSRITALGQKYNLRILLTIVDIANHEDSVKELCKTSLVNNLTLILAWSAQEAGKYLELFKSYEHTAPTAIRAPQGTSYSDKVTDFFTVPRGINKTDAVSILGNFGSVRGAVNARPEDLGLLAGWGDKKVQRWCSTVREGFRVGKAAKRTATKRAGVKGDVGEMSMGMRVGPAIPIAKASAGTPTTSREAPVPPMQETGRGGDTDLWEPGEDEEEALLLALAEQNVAPAGGRGGASCAEEVSTGVLSALAKLREQQS
ncbi:MAG: ssDNA endonuclease and repair protein rad10 [Trizodia sp. TS-e1964]|nr:MAG: ssDNA endonuclease and repair protein rad10 [Trizodia sp. TS-e1964]